VNSSDKMKNKIKSFIWESIQIKEEIIKNNIKQIEQIVKIISAAFKNGGKVIVFGNGGSAADAQHIAAEFVGRFKKERAALPAIALSCNSSVLTALGNDYGFEIVFSRQVEALGQKCDVAIGISTSGKSKDCIEAVSAAKKIGMKTITLTGCGVSSLSKLSDLNITVPSNNTPRIQEAHILIAHIICELVEEELYGK